MTIDHVRKHVQLAKKLGTVSFSLAITVTFMSDKCTASGEYAFCVMRDGAWVKTATARRVTKYLMDIGAEPV